MSSTVTSVDWNAAAETVVTASLSEIPVIGTAVSALTTIFWPSSGEDVWGEIRAQVQDLMQEYIADEVYAEVQNSLAGLQGDLNYYTNAVLNGDSADNISSYWISAQQNFTLCQPSFQAKGYEVLLLPLFAQFANLYLTLLRDGVSSGNQTLYPSGNPMGWTATDVINNAATPLQTLITDYVDWVNQWYPSGLNTVRNATPSGNKDAYHDCQPFRSTNAYVREMTLGVLDYACLWTFFRFQTNVNTYLIREIYSDPYGSCDDSGNIDIPGQAASFPTQIKVWGASEIDGVEVTYNSGQGPGAESTTGRMGDKDGGSLVGTFDVANNPVVIANARSGNVVDALKFTFQDGSETSWLGGNSGGGSGHATSYAGHLLSSIWINGVSAAYGCADCIVFGFKYPKPSGSYVTVGTTPVA